MDRLIFLERIQAYTSLPPTCVSALSGALARRTAEEGTSLPERAGERKELAMIASGIARVYVTTHDGRDVTQYFARAEDFVLANFDGERARVERIEAVTDLTYVVLPYARLEALMAEYVGLAVFFAQMLRERSLRARDRAGRRARREDVETYESFLHTYPGLESEVPTVHIASYLGMTPGEFMRVRQRYRERSLM